MKALCPKCQRTLDGDEINVVTDLARCPGCGEVFPLSPIVNVLPDHDLDVSNPPRGAWYVEEFHGFTVGATTRHPVAFIIIPFLCGWSGVWLAGIFGRQFAQAKFDLYRSLFAIPFFLGTVVFASLALMSVCGQVVVRVRDLRGEVFTGIGPFGWRRHFDLEKVTDVKLESTVNDEGQRKMSILLDGPRKLRFGSWLFSEVRCDFIAGVLRQALRDSQNR